MSGAPTPKPGQDWYARRDELRPGMVFLDHDGDRLRLDRTVPGDGSKWYADTYGNGTWFHDDHTVEPGDLVELVEE
jgi:hypothetical protein